MEVTILKLQAVPTGMLEADTVVPSSISNRCKFQASERTLLVRDLPPTHILRL